MFFGREVGKEKEVKAMLSSILTQGEEELLTAHLPPEVKEAVIKWAKQARLDNSLLNMAIDGKIKVTYRDNPGIFFEGEGEENDYLLGLRRSIVRSLV